MLKSVPMSNKSPGGITSLISVKFKKVPNYHKNQSQIKRLKRPDLNTITGSQREWSESRSSIRKVRMRPRKSLRREKKGSDF